MRFDYRLACLGMMLALAACNGEKTSAAAGSAGGEILPGSVSDAMLPVDSVRSQPPLAPKGNDEGDKDGKKDGKKPGKPQPSAKAAEPAAPPEPPASPAPVVKPDAE